jgi:uncharacterized membrane protein
MFAAIPLVFATQQAAEGTVWVTMDGDPHAVLHRLAVNLFLGCALVIWPTWLPVSLRAAETNSTRRRVLTALSAFGLLFSACAAVVLMRGQPLAQIAGHSIRYEYGGSGNASQHFFYLVAYVIPVVAPLFVSTTELSRTIGTLLIVSLALTAFTERDTLTSVWCFFAALLSGLIWVAVERTRSRTSTPQMGPSGAR